MKNMKKACAASVLLSLLFAGCSGKKENSGKVLVEKSDTAVVVLELKLSDMEDYIEFGGTVSAVDTVTVLPAVAGKVAAIYVDAGDRVSKNQVIAKIDPSKPGAEFALSPVKASAEGTVTAVFPSVGAYVTTSSSIVEVSSTDRLEIKVNVSERFVPFISINQTAQVSFKAFPDEKFEAIVCKISPILDPVTRTMQVTLKLTDARGMVKSGMFAHVKLTTEHKENVLAVPNRAVLYSMGNPFVYTVSEKEGKTCACRTDIQTGLSVDGMTEVTAGITEGMKVIVKGQNLVSEGQKVKMILETGGTL